MDGGQAGSAEKEVEAGARARPHQAGAVTRAHVCDQAVADRLVEADREATLVAAACGHDPQPLDEAGVEPVRRDEGDQVAAWAPRRRPEIQAAGPLRPLPGQVDDVAVARA